MDASSFFAAAVSAALRVCACAVADPRVDILTLTMKFGLWSGPCFSSSSYWGMGSCCFVVHSCRAVLTSVGGMLKS